MLSLSQSTGYAILALSHLDPKGKDLVLAADVAAHANIPRPYLVKIVGKLQQANLIEGRRGQKGGMCLMRPANEITLLDVVYAIDGPDSLDRCLLGLPDCSGEKPCPVHAFWLENKPLILEKLRTTTIDQVRDFTMAGWKMTIPLA